MAVPLGSQAGCVIESLYVVIVVVAGWTLLGYLSETFAPKVLDRLSDWIMR